MGKAIINGKEVETIDCTPTWESVWDLTIMILPVLLLALEDGNEEGKAIAKSELHNMAMVADAYVETTKGKVEK